MIFAIVEGVKEQLAAHEFPVKVSIGPERPTTGRRHHVVIERDRERDETIAAPMGSAVNPSRVFVRLPAYVARVYAADYVAAALPWEHDREVDKIVDGVLVALRDWAQEQGAIFAPTGGRPLPPKEVDGAETIARGACYELSFTMARSVDRKRYDGTANDTATIADVQNATRVSLDGTTFEEID